MTTPTWSGILTGLVAGAGAKSAVSARASCAWEPVADAAGPTGECFEE